MDIGIGLPNPVPGVPGTRLAEWARRAEERGFTQLATIDRIAYPSHDSLISLAAAGAATERIGLMTNVILGPTRNPVLLAKEAASVDQISGGRLTLGVGVGARPDDFTASGQEFRGRGRRWDEELELIHRAWRGEAVSGAQKPVCPTPVNGQSVPILVGGMGDAAVARTVRWGVGWTAGGGAADAVGPFGDRVREAWKDAGKEGSPWIVALAYFALGDQAEEGAAWYLKDYYGPWADRMLPGVPKSPETARETVARYAEAGVDTLILDPTVPELEQVDLLAEAVLERG